MNDPGYKSSVDAARQFEQGMAKLRAVFTPAQLVGILYDLMLEVVENPRYLEDSFDRSEFPLCTTGFSRALEAAVNVLVDANLADWTDGNAHINFQLRARDTPK